MDSLHFFYDDISSLDMGILNVNIDNGLFSEHFLPNRNIVEQFATNREQPYFLKVTHEPLSFPMRIFFKEGFDKRELRKVTKWLYQEYYKPLIFSSQPNRVYYAMLEGESTVYHNGVGEGYVDLNVRCNSPYAYTPVFVENNVLQKTVDTTNVFSIDTKNYSQDSLSNIVVSSNGDSFELESITKWSQLSDYVTWGEII